MYITHRFFSIGVFIILSLDVSAQFNTIKRDRMIIKIGAPENIPIKRDRMITKVDAPENIPIKRENEEIKNRPDTTQKKETKILFALPLTELTINSCYGYRNDPFTNKKKFHHGIDFAANSENVFAMMPGKIKDIGFKKNGLGNYVVVEHGEFLITYAHLHTSLGTKGDYVNAGSIIGLSGSTGRSTGEHLHLSVKYKGKSINPEPLVTYIERYLKEVRNLTVEYKKRE